jgi:16S rRNA C967 or C1407 C5-methylase (RsmB/RsmF family)
MVTLPPSSYKRLFMVRTASVLLMIPMVWYSQLKKVHTEVEDSISKKIATTEPSKILVFCNCWQPWRMRIRYSRIKKNTKNKKSTMSATNGKHEKVQALIEQVIEKEVTEEIPQLFIFVQGKFERLTIILVTVS